MKTPFAPFFRSLLKRFRPSPAVAPVYDRRLEVEPIFSPDDFRNLLIDALDDPAFARLLARRLAGPVFPVEGAVDPTVTTDAGTTGYVPYFTNDTGKVENSVAFQTGGKLGVGTQSPGATLDVSASTATIRAIGSTNPYIYAQDTTNNLVAKLQALDTFGLVGTETNHDFTVYTNNLERVRFDTSGKVGIGTASPGATLDVSATTATIRAIGSANPYIFAQDTTNNLIAKLQALDTLGLVGTESNHSFAVYTNNLERVRFDTSGNVGIGTTSPQATLHVKGGNAIVENGGGFGFLESANNHLNTVMYRPGGSGEGADITVLRNYRNEAHPSDPIYTLLKIWAPPDAVVNDREATLALARGNNDEEVLDVYNNGYTNEKQYGLRGLKRKGSTGEFRDFVFDQWETDPPNRVELPAIMVLKKTRKVGIGIRDNLSARLNIRGDFTAKGTVTVSAGSTTVTGVNTLFSAEINVGDKIKINATGETRTVTAIASPPNQDTSLTVDSNFSSPAGGSAMTVMNNLLRLDDSSGTTKVFVTEQGNVGLGTTNPAATLEVQGDALLAKSGGKVGFYGTTPITIPTVTGSRGGNVALANLLTALSQLGLIVNSTTA